MNRRGRAISGLGLDEPEVAVRPAVHDDDGV